VTGPVSATLSTVQLAVSWGGAEGRTAAGPAGAESLLAGVSVGVRGLGFGLALLSPLAGAFACDWVAGFVCDCAVGAAGFAGIVVSPAQRETGVQARTPQNKAAAVRTSSALSATTQNPDRYAGAL